RGTCCRYEIALHPASHNAPESRWPQRPLSKANASDLRSAVFRLAKNALIGAKKQKTPGAAWQPGVIRSSRITGTVKANPIAFQQISKPVYPVLAEAQC